MLAVSTIANDYMQSMHTYGKCFVGRVCYPLAIGTCDFIGMGNVFMLATMSNNDKAKNTIKIKLNRVEA